MLNMYMVDNHQGLSDIIPIFSGYEECRPRHSFGPYIREHYLIHICLSGQGIIIDKFGEHKVRAGEFFVIRPGEVTTYSADERDPWVYLWIAFRGTYADIFMNGKTVYAASAGLSERMREAVLSGNTDAHIHTAFIYELINLAFPDDKPVKDDFSKIKRYIKYNYMEDISVENLSKTFGFERSYLYRMFMKKCGIGIKEYITQTRMERAREFILEGYSVATTASMVGYRDEFNFSRAFKKYFGTAPSLCRKNENK